jgi:phosphoribosylanthranilate isomerase
MTSVTDALIAAELGVDAIGLIFYAPSPRNVSLTLAEEIASSLPPFVSRVGVFVDETKDKINSILTAVPLDVLQFHGQESAEFCRQFGKPYIKTFHVGDLLEFKGTETYHDAIGFLFDTKINSLPGGSGIVFNWNLLPQDLQKPIILAGGLNSENISQAILEVKPYAVDITSGVEQAKGIKDPTKMRQFMSKVNNIRNEFS